MSATFQLSILPWLLEGAAYMAEDLRRSTRDMMQGLCAWLAANPLRSADLIITANPTGFTDTHIRFSGPDANDVAKAILPLEFELRPVGSLPELDLQYRLAVTRRLQLFPLGTTRRTPSSSRIPTQAGQEMAVGRHWIPTKGPVESPQNRRIAIASTMAIDSPTGISTLEGMFLELRRCAPGRIQITMSSVDAANLLRDRPLAAVFLQWLPDESQRDRVLPNDEALRIAIERFWLPNDHLCDVIVSIAAADQAAVTRLAQSYVNAHGGHAALEVCEHRHLGHREAHESAAMVAEYREAWLDDWLERSLGQLQERRGLANYLYGQRFLFTADEAPTIFRLPFGIGGALSGTRGCAIPPFRTTLHENAPEMPGSGTIRVGVRSDRPYPLSNDQVQSEIRSDKARWFSFPLQSTRKGVFIGGSAGAGKTLLLGSMVKQAVNQGVPCLMIEPSVKSEFHQLLGNQIPVQKYGFDPYTKYLPHDPFRLIHNTTVAAHVPYLSAVLASSMATTEPVIAQVIESSIHAYYTAPPEQGGCGLNPHSRGGLQAHRIDKYRFTSGDHKAGEVGAVFPSFATYHQYFFGAYLPKMLRLAEASGSRAAALAYEWQTYFERRFENLMRSPVGLMFDCADAIARKTLNPASGAFLYDFTEQLLRENAIVELRGLSSDEHKSLVMSLLLVALFERRTAAGTTDAVRHLLVLDEAHRILGLNESNQGRSEIVGGSPRDRVVEMFVTMLLEFRGLGQGWIAADQRPARLVADVLGQAEVRLAMVLRAKADRDAIADAIPLDHPDYLNRLSTGQLIAYDSSTDRPALLTVPYPWPSHA